MSYILWILSVCYCWRNDQGWFVSHFDQHRFPGRAWQMPTQLPQLSSAVSSCQQLSLTGGLWVLSDLLRTHPEEERKLLETSYDQFSGRFTVLSIGTWNETCQHFLKICWIWATSSYQLPVPKDTGWDGTIWRRVAGGAWLSQRVARWLKLQVNQLRHMTGWGKPENTWAKKCTENSSNSQRRTLVDPQVSSGFYIVDFCVTSGLIFENWHITYTCENVQATSSLTPHIFFMISQHQLRKSVAKSMWNLDFPWISHGFPHGWKWDPSWGSTATWR